MTRLEGKVSSSGEARAVALVTNDPSTKPGDQNYILVTQKSDPEISPLIYGAKGIVTEVGGLMSHLSVVSREIGIPCLVGCTGSYKNISDRSDVTLDASGRLNSLGSVEYDSQP